jgi:hypothetical protein
MRGPSRARSCERDTRGLSSDDRAPFARRDPSRLRRTESVVAHLLERRTDAAGCGAAWPATRTAAVVKRLPVAMAACRVACVRCQRRRRRAAGEGLLPLGRARQRSRAMGEGNHLFEPCEPLRRRCSQGLGELSAPSGLPPCVPFVRRPPFSHGALPSGAGFLPALRYRRGLAGALRGA